MSSQGYLVLWEFPVPQCLNCHTLVWHENHLRTSPIPQTDQGSSWVRKQAGNDLVPWLFLRCPRVFTGVLAKGYCNLARGETSRVKSNGSFAGDVQIRVQILKERLSKHSQFTTHMGSCDRHCRVGWMDQNIPQLRATSPSLNPLSAQ